MNAKIIVLDNGSGTSRAGYAGEDMPRFVIPSIVATIRQSLNIYVLDNSIYIGKGVCEKAGILSLKYPIEHGVVTNWNDFEQIFNYQFFKELKVNTSEHPILLTETDQVDKQNRETLIQLMFETYNFPSFYIKSQGVLSLFSSNSTTGLAFNSGEGCSQAVPIYEGYNIPHAIKTSKIAGKMLNNWMNQLLREKGFCFDSPSEKEIVRKIKEKICHISLDYNREINTIGKDCYYLPDQNSITFREEQIKCPELLFQPEMFNSEEDGIQRLIFDSIKKCDLSFRNELFRRIYISGGTTLMRGFQKRLENEIRNLRFNCVSGYKYVKVLRTGNDARFSAWKGGSMLASTDCFADSMISKNEYYDCGPEIVHLKCL